MKTRYFTFGQNHAHAFNGVTYDRNCVVKITAEDPRGEMLERFGVQWSMEYDKCPDLTLFPRGVFELK